VVGACGSLSAVAAFKAVDSGIDGRVLLGPTCPVQRIGHPCVRGYQTTVAVCDAVRGKRVTTFHSARDGRFKVGLPAGRYRLEGVNSGLPRLRPVLVTVHRHRFSRITVVFDTGIR
jgi:hypothetical protein